MENLTLPLKGLFKTLITSLDEALTKIDDDAVMAPFQAFGFLNTKILTLNHQLKMLDYSFYSENDFYNQLSLKKRFLVYETMRAALLFMFMKNGMGYPTLSSIEDFTRSNISVFPLSEEGTTLFLIADSFRCMSQLLNPNNPIILEEKHFDPNEPSNDAILLGYNYARYHKKRSIFVFIDDNFEYTGQPYSEENITAFKLHLSKTLEFMGIHDKLESLEVTTYDNYAKTICPAKTVDYFLSRLRDCAQAHILCSNNIGTALQQRQDKLIDYYATSSNLTVRTKYFCKNSNINPSHVAFSNIAPCQNPLYKNLFDELSERATANLKLLHSNRVFCALSTSEWLYSNFGQSQNLDNTFVCAGYFKLVELLLTEILTTDYKGSYISSSHGQQVIDDNEKWLMLGNMFQFVSFDKTSPVSSSPYQPLMREAFENWTKHVRNGYFHKDILCAEEVTAIRNKTFEVVYMILGTLPK